MSNRAEPYIIIAQQLWDLNLGSNAKNIAIELSKTRPVLYVNPPLDINTLLKQIKTPAGRKRMKPAIGLSKNIVHADVNTWVYTPSNIGLSITWLRSNQLFDILNRLNAYKFLSGLGNAVEQLGWNMDECVLFNDSQMFPGKYIKKYLQPKHSFYYIRDNLAEHPYFKRHGSRIEPDTIRSADIVFANSSYLAGYARAFNKKSFDVGQGCELEMYDAAKQYQPPADIISIPHPRIGYVGFLTGERLDILLLEKLAIMQPSWQFILIGPEEVLFQQSRLHQMSNVHFLGAKKAYELPAYIQQMDVCINPQLKNDLTIGNYPRKIDEYLAMGKATVATDTSAMKMFLPHVKLATGVQGYADAIHSALEDLADMNKKEKIDFAKSHTWQACINKISEQQISYEQQN